MKGIYKMANYTKSEFIEKTSTKLAEFEPERRKWLLKLLLIEILIGLIIWLLFKGCSYLSDSDPNASAVLAMLSIVGIIFFFMNIRNTNKAFKRYIKKACKYQVFKAFNMSMGAKSGFSKSVLIESNLFLTYTYSKTDDVITGCYNNVDYKIAETKLVVKGRKNNEYDVFKGVIISFKSNKDFNTETLVTTKGDNNIRNYQPNAKFLIVFSLILPITFGILFISTIFSIPSSTGFNFQDFFKLFFEPENIFSVFFMLMPAVIITLFAIDFYNQKKKMNDVKLEDISFDKRFNVYTKDQIEARYLLTPTFMERLKSLETAFGTKGIKCSFFNNRIMFAIPTQKDLFELGSLFTSLKSNKAVEKFYNELNSIHEMIDHFKLNEKIGL